MNRQAAKEVLYRILWLGKWFIPIFCSILKSDAEKIQSRKLAKKGVNYEKLPKMAHFLFLTTLGQAWGHLVKWNAATLATTNYPKTSSKDVWGEIP